jgi:DDE domain
VGPSWRVDETYVKIKGRWAYLYRAVDKEGKTVDVLLRAKRDVAAAKVFFRRAFRNLKVSGLLKPRRSRLAAAKRPNSIRRVLSGWSVNAMCNRR